MPHIRHATECDIELICMHRHAMFADNRLGSSAALAAMDARFEPWLRERLHNGDYVGLLLSEGEGTEIIAAAGIYFMDWPPHFLHAEPMRAYLLNFYTAPQARKHGYARLLLERAVELSRARGATVITLHASKMGKPIYEAYGFKQSNEMMLRPEK